ncbi:MAG: VWA domain-containing protein, partial [Gammaproteobacteria bacterium]
RRRSAPDGGRGVLVHPGVTAFGSATAVPVACPWARRLTGAALALVVVALAQPQWIGPWIQPVPSGRDLMLLVDTSATMSIRDFQWQGRSVERITVLKALLKRFVEARHSDRFGIIAYGSVAGTLVPPTFDRDLLTGMSGRLQVGIAGQNTALGDAIGLALKQLHGQARLRPALILFSDGGASNAGQMTTREAVELARRRGVAIYTVAVSSGAGGANSADGGAGTGEGPPDLSQIARLTGGRFYRAGSSGALAAVIHRIGTLEKTIPRAPTRHAVQPWYLLPLGLAVVLLSVARWVRGGGGGS